MNNGLLDFEDEVIEIQNKYRYYQIEAIEAAIKASEAGEKGILAMATGTGKTEVFIGYADHRLKYGKVLGIAHTEELVNQIQARFERTIGITPSVEMAMRRGRRSADIVAGSIKTMANKRLLTWPQDHFGTVIIDEAHHARAKTYRSLIEHFKDSALLGVTATPYSKGLGDVFDRIIYEYPLHRAIKDKFLCPIVGKKVNNFEIDLSLVRISKGDFQDADLAEAIVAHIGEMAVAIKEQAGHLKTMVFMPDVESSRVMAEALQKVGLDAAYVSGTGSMEIGTRRQNLYDFSMGNVTHLVSCNVLVEGYDEPSVQCVTICAPTASEIKYSQMVGRGTRLHQTKKNLLLLEFTFNSERISLVRPVDLFKTKGYEEKVRSKVELEYENAEDPFDFMLELDDAADYMHSTKYLMDRVKMRVLEFKTFDPFTLAELVDFDINQEFEIHYEGRKLEGKITHSQAELLTRYGVGKEELTAMDKSTASALIDHLIRNQGVYPTNAPASPKQIAFLQRHGIQANGMRVAQASLLIKNIKEKLHG